MFKSYERELFVHTMYVCMIDTHIEFHSRQPTLLTRSVFENIFNCNLIEYIYYQNFRLFIN